MLGDQAQFVVFEKTFQQQNRRTDAGLAQLQGLFDTGHRKAVGFRFQRLRAAHRAMPVGIGLDHREGLAAAQALGQAVVVTQCIQIDQRLRRTHYAASCCARALRGER